MAHFDDNPIDRLSPDREPDPSPNVPLEGLRDDQIVHPAPWSQQPIDPSAPLAGDPITYAAQSTHAVSSTFNGPSVLPEDLRISWYWPHLILFIFFTFASFIVVQTAMFIYYGPKQSMPKEQLEQYLLNKPQFLFGTNMLWYASVFLFLYVTLSVLRDAPFWSSLGWKKLSARLTSTWGGPWSYFLGGCASGNFRRHRQLARERHRQNAHSRALQKSRECCPPDVHGSIHRAAGRRNCLPRIFLSTSRAHGLQNHRRFGVKPPEAIRTGMFSSVVITGVLFGLMHGAQLGWTWSVVALLILVGVIFTFVRARTGTVLASFLLHLGYNSMIAVTTIIGTHGFTRFPPAHKMRVVGRIDRRRSTRFAPQTSIQYSSQLLCTSLNRSNGPTRAWSCSTSAASHRGSSLHLHDYREVASAITEMVIRGAPAIGVAAAMGVAIGVLHSNATPSPN